MINLKIKKKRRRKLERRIAREDRDLRKQRKGQKKDIENYYREAMDIINRPEKGARDGGGDDWELPPEDEKDADGVYRVDMEREKKEAVRVIESEGEPHTTEELKARAQARRKASSRRKRAGGKGRDRKAAGTGREARKEASYIKDLSELPLKQVKDSIKGMIPDYVITHQIASGGFATVYKAIDKDGKPIALKLPKFLDETVDMSVLKNFEAEANIWKNLKHPNIVNFHEGGIRPIPYMAIELMEGGNLSQLMKNHRFSADDAVKLMLQILDGIAYAHRMASVHRDIKPENILFDRGGRPKITDWGIGKLMASEGVTKTVGTKGTLAYGSPEQISRKKFGDVDWRTDVFQLGIMFYELLTGVNPFHDEDPLGVIGKITGEDPEPPSKVDPRVPTILDDIVMKALQKVKKDRWASADIMYDRLKSSQKKGMENVNKYRRALKRALRDGTISEDEEEMLSELRDLFGISRKKHASLVREMLEE